MIGKHATFNPIAFARADKLARTHTTEFLENLGWSVIEHPDKYAQDLVATRGSDRFFVECEQKPLWKGERFPFNSVQLPERKQKFFADKTLFFIWNNEWTSAFIFWSHKISHLDPVEVKNRRIANGEYFFQIPLELTKQVYK